MSRIRTSSSFFPYSYEPAMDCLRHARSPQAGRPLQNNTRLVPCVVGDVEAVGIKLHNTIVVAYLPDGNVVLNTGGWDTVTTKQRINSWSPARIGTGIQYNVRGEKVSPYARLLVLSSPLGTTPVKIQKCRLCKGTGKLKPYVQEGKWIYTPKEDGSYGGHYFEKFEEPLVTISDCYPCSATGQRDYGSKSVLPYFADGVIVDQQGMVVGFGPKPYDTSSTSSSRGDSYESRYFGITPSPVVRSDSYYQSAQSPAATSVDSETVKFQQVSDEAHAEMLEWMGILDKKKVAR